MLRFSISDRLSFAQHQSPSFRAQVTSSVPANATIPPPANAPSVSAPAVPAAPSNSPGPGLTATQLSDLLAQARHLARSGVDFFLLREPDLPTRDLAHLARELLSLFRDSAAPTRLLLHSRPDIAVATGSHGVHLPSAPGQLAPGHIRELYRITGLPTPVVSLSCHTLDDIRRALAPDQEPDLILFGPVFEKRVRGQLVQPGTGLTLLRHACQLAAPTPVLALGGVTEANTPACLRAGAAGFAAIRLFASLST